MLVNEQLARQVCKTGRAKFKQTYQRYNSDCPSAGNGRRSTLFDLKNLASERGAKAKPPMIILRNGTFLMNAYIANSWLARFKGIFAYLPLGCEDALILCRCSAVHTVGLRQPIDVVFVDRFGQVLKCVTVRPYSLAICRKAHSVIEMSSGTTHRLGLSIGQYLCVKEFSLTVPLVSEQDPTEHSLNSPRVSAVKKKGLS